MRRAQPVRVAEPAREVDRVDRPAAAVEGGEDAARHARRHRPAGADRPRRGATEKAPARIAEDERAEDAEQPALGRAHERGDAEHHADGDERREAKQLAAVDVAAVPEAEQQPGAQVEDEHHRHRETDRHDVREQRHADDRRAEAGQAEHGVGEGDGERRGGDGGERQVGHRAAIVDVRCILHARRRERRRGKRRPRRRSAGRRIASPTGMRLISADGVGASSSGLGPPARRPAVRRHRRRGSPRRASSRLAISSVSARRSASPIVSFGTICTEPTLSVTRVMRGATCRSSRREMMRETTIANRRGACAAGRPRIRRRRGGPRRRAGAASRAGRCRSGAAPRRRSGGRAAR